MLPRFTFLLGYAIIGFRQSANNRKEHGMKKLLCLILAAFMAFGLTECAGSNEQLIYDVISQLDELDASGESPDNARDASLPEQQESAESEEPADTQQSAGEPLFDENGSYTARDDVALYIHTYGKLPQNFITKKEAQALGWSGGSLEPYAPGKCIGGTRFGNYEGRLPEKDGRTYTECDIDTLGQSSRGAKRIVFSNDGLIYYTEDHYSTFTLLYGKE